MSDLVMQGFLKEQLAEVNALAAASDLFEVHTLGPDRFRVVYRCHGLVCDPDGSVRVAEEFHVGIRITPDYCRRVDPVEVLTWLYPFDVWHPNIRYPYLCAGGLKPSTDVCDLIFQCYEILTYQNWSPHDALNPAAAQWARNNQHLFPVDTRPLKWRRPPQSVANSLPQVNGGDR